MCRKFDGFDQLVRRQPLVHTVYSLIKYRLNGVAIVGQCLFDSVRAAYGSRMAGHEMLRLLGEHLIETHGPFPDVPVRRTTDRIEVGKRLVEVVRWQQRSLLRQPHVNLVVRLADCMNQLDLHARDFERMFARECLVGRYEVGLRTSAQDQPGAYTCVGKRAGRQRDAELASAAHEYGWPENVRTLVHETHQRLVRVDIRVVATGQNLGPINMIIMVVRVNDRTDRFGCNLVELGLDRFRGSRALHRVYYDNPVVTLDQDRVRQSETHSDVNAVRDLDHALLKLPRVRFEHFLASVVPAIAHSTPRPNNEKIATPRPLPVQPALYIRQSGILNKSARKPGKCKHTRANLHPRKEPFQGVARCSRELG